MATSIYNTILSQCKASIDALSLTYNSNPVPCVVRKLPTAEETLDTLPLILVVPSKDPETVELFGFEKTATVAYWADIVIVAAGNRDFTTNLDVYLNWREQIRKLFQAPPLAGAPTVWRVEMHPLEPIDRETITRNYDVSGLSALFLSIEQRGN